jgi:BlaI family penicillinase repressor
MTRPQPLGRLSLEIVRVLWQAGEASAAQVGEALPKSFRRAPTTIATMLQKLEKKGVVTHRREGRQFVYRPLVSEEEIRAGMIADLTEQMFGGDTAQLVKHLVEEADLDESALDALRNRIAERKAEESGE